MPLPLSSGTLQSGRESRSDKGSYCMPITSLRRLGESLDRLITVEFRPHIGSVPAGLVAPLYAAARNFHQVPLTTLASQMFVTHAEHQSVLIVTGAGIAPALPGGETDGPPGAAALAHALKIGLDSRPVIVTESRHALAVENSLTAIALSDVEVELFAQQVSPEQEALRLIETHAPTVIVFIERDGRNSEGRYHGVRGNCRPRGTVAPADELALLAHRRGIRTVGVGDGGNEVGFGAFRDVVASGFPGGAECQEGCESGRITTIATDVCVAASISNWGAYGIAAALAGTLRNPHILIRPEKERELIEACLDGGARDGATGEASVSVDGVSAHGNAAAITLMHELVAMYCL